MAIDLPGAEMIAFFDVLEAGIVTIAAEAVNLDTFVSIIMMQQPQDYNMALTKSMGME